MREKEGNGMWQVTEQDFDTEGVGPGRIVVELKDGTVLSVITTARNDYIRTAAESNLLAMLGGGGWEQPEVMADEGEFEVALLNEWGDMSGQPLDPQPEEWAAHQILSDEDVVYTHVTPDMLDRLVNAVGLRDSSVTEGEQP
jgi:hypothetical protein